MGDYKTEIIGVIDTEEAPKKEDKFLDYINSFHEKNEENTYQFKSYSYDYHYGVPFLCETLEIENSLKFTHYPLQLEKEEYQFYDPTQLQELQSFLLHLKDQTLTDHLKITDSIKKESLKTIELLSLNPLKDMPTWYVEKETKALSELKSYYDHEFMVTPEELATLYQFHDEKGYCSELDCPTELKAILKKTPRNSLMMSIFQSLGFIKAFLNCYLPKAQKEKKSLLMIVF